MGCIFDSERRTRELTYTSYYPDTTVDESSPLQFGAIDLNCDTGSDFAAMCSALVSNQTTKKISMYMQVNPDEHAESPQKWKWVAYAFFSKRARESSALETLALTSIDSLSMADVEAFASIVASDHPEEDLLVVRVAKFQKEMQHSRKEVRFSGGLQAMANSARTSTRSCSTLLYVRSVLSAMTEAVDQWTHWFRVLAAVWSNVVISSFLKTQRHQHLLKAEFFTIPGV